MHDECLEFWAMIGRQVSTPIDRGGRKSVDDQLAVAWQAGWTPGALARWLTEQVAAARRLSNPAGFVIARLREIPAPADVAPSQREIDERRALEARRRAEDRARERDNCTMCDASGYIGRQVCDHDPNRIDRNRHGVALARRALADALAARREDTGSEPPAAPEGAETTGRAVG